MRCARCNQYAPVNRDGHCSTCARKLAGLCAFDGCTEPRHGRLCWRHQAQRQRGEVLRPLEPNLTPAELAAEVEWLLGTDSPDHIAARLGRTRDSLYRSLRRIGRRDLIDALAAETMRAAELMRESRMGQVFGPDPRKAHGRVA